MTGYPPGIDMVDDEVADSSPACVSAVFAIPFALLSLLAIVAMLALRA